MDEAEITFQIARYRPANQAPAAEPQGGPGRLCNPQLRGLRREGRSEPYVGGATRAWLKVKVPGWTDPEDRWKRVRLESH